MTMLLTTIQILTCAYVLYISVMVLNKMSKQTRHTWRGSYLCLAAASVCGIIYEPSVPTCVYAVGVAIFLACNEEEAHHASERKSIS